MRLSREPRGAGHRQRPALSCLARGSCFFEHEIRNLERILQPQGGFRQASDRAGVWSSGSCPPLWPVSPAVPAGWLHAVPFSVTQPMKGAGVSVPATRGQAAREHPPRLVGRQSQEPAAPYSAETRSDGARAASKSLGGKCWGPPRRMWLPAPGTGGPVSPALGMAAFCCPLVRSGSRAHFGVPMALTPPFGAPPAGAQPLGSPGQATSLQDGGTLWWELLSLGGCSMSCCRTSHQLKTHWPPKFLGLFPPPTASWDPTSSPHRALGHRVLSPRCQPWPPLSFGTCSLPSSEQTFTLTSARAAVAVCK